MKSSAAAIHQIYFSKLEINTRHEQSHSICWNCAPKQGAFCWIPSWLLNQLSYQKYMGRTVSHTLSSRHGLVLGKHASSKRRIQPFATALWVRWEQVPAFSFFHLCDPWDHQEVSSSACRKNCSREPQCAAGKVKANSLPWWLSAVLSHTTGGDIRSVSTASSCHSSDLLQESQSCHKDHGLQYSAHLSLSFCGAWLKFLTKAHCSWTCSSVTEEQLGIGEYEMLQILKMNCGM